MVENLLKDHEITTRPYEKRKKFDDQFADSISFNFPSSIVRVAACYITTGSCLFQFDHVFHRIIQASFLVRFCFFLFSSAVIR